MMPARSELQRAFLVAGSTCPVVRLEPGSGMPLGRAVIAIGAFDGFHIGHQTLIAKTIADARERGAGAFVVTFDPDPDCVVGPGPAPRLLCLDDRLRALAASGVDGVVVVPFTPELARLDHAAFFEQVLLPSLDVCAVHVGSDFRMGAGGASDVAALRSWGDAHGIEVFGHTLVLADGTVVSATRIRSLLAEGDVAGAAYELGRPHLVRGTVVSGRGKGTGMGFPTANISVDAAMQMPADGVYAGLALLDDIVWPAAVNVGLPPTFASLPGSAHLEANLIGLSDNVRGHDIALAFCRFIRPSRVFATNDELVSTVLANIDEIRSDFGGSGVAIG
ncbi:riboflavin biosynthesis protein RibF [Collinsella tanakaei]|uniref:riboflavin biosynthesis protein RibF n=1 Tax=Collinsella tanakaei TaxID=626935 RepID=UPI00195DBFDC|nr:riboflavin biosynthesis protein RibF [Collinsella tanakaei]MBM6779129.1 riboflavin biosynthesis protein RibF [Collinsella tanakaei]